MNNFNCHPKSPNCHPKSPRCHPRSLLKDLRNNKDYNINRKAKIIIRPLNMNLGKEDNGENRHLQEIIIQQGINQVNISLISNKRTGMYLTIVICKR